MYAPGTFDVSRARTPSTGILFAVSLGGDRDATEARCWFQHSIVKQSHSNRHDSSPLLFGGRGDRPHFPSLTGVRERSADWRYFLVAPYGARALAGTPPPGAPLWRLPPRDRLVGSGRGFSPSLSRRLSPPFIRTVPAFLRRRPFLVRADGNPGRPGPLCAYTAARAPRLLRQPRRP